MSKGSVGFCFDAPLMQYLYTDILIPALPIDTHVQTTINMCLLLCLYDSRYYLMS